MKSNNVKNNKFKTLDGREVELTPEEMKFLNAIKRLDKMEYGNLVLFGGSNGLGVRYGDYGAQHTIANFINVPIDGGDGGDNF